MSHFKSQKRIVSAETIRGNKVTIYSFLARATPFRISVVTDANEVLGANAAVGNAKTNEASGDDNTGKNSLGTQGFSLQFEQQLC